MDGHGSSYYMDALSYWTLVAVVVAVAAVMPLPGLLPDALGSP